MMLRHASFSNFRPHSWACNGLHSQHLHHYLLVKSAGGIGRTMICILRQGLTTKLDIHAHKRQRRVTLHCHGRPLFAGSWLLPAPRTSGNVAVCPGTCNAPA
mmetsp:Transcript_9490/g.33617  ORF Transcript_9490/g.33617 Transcript_9490/m.33617 type:complete len:102 (+) Transcript_9490:903-1208(+)